MKTTPVALIERGELNLRQGIKSSLSNLRSVVAILYIIYLTNDKRSIVEYTQEYTEAGNTKIKLKDELRRKINILFPTISNTSIDRVPVFSSQMEALQVGIELFLKLGKISFVGSHSDSSERTGGNRFDKVIKFGTNIKLIDLYFSAFTSSQKTDLLSNWIEDKDPSDQIISDGLKQMLTIFSEETQFKIRTNSGEISFQQEGIYKELVKNNTVESNDIHELVGPYRILKSYIREGLHPYVKDNRVNGFELKRVLDDEFKNYQLLVANGLDIIPKRTVVTQLEAVSKEDKTEMHEPTDICLQQIFYGAPGTGKSYFINEITNRESVVRTTFHPDSDYSTFVGCYKPTTKEEPRYTSYGEKAITIKDENGNILTEDRIVYEFVDQAFLQAYIKAWRFYAEAKTDTKPKKQFLVIEEINRGNCAQIFGDLFQLLDRNKSGFSDYPIQADNDMKKHLAKAFKDLSIAQAEKINVYYKGQDIVSQVLSGEILLLPNNLYIWATMNTSDQSLFPIDSAFKRRWDWQYMPISKGRDEQGDELNWKISVGTKEYYWWSFLDKINEHIGSTTNSEDKKLGYFFCRITDGYVSAETFVGKVIFYLWNDVFKDFGFESTIFNDVDGTTLSFDKFYNTDCNNGRAFVRKDKVGQFLDNLKVEMVSETVTNEVLDEDGNSNNTKTKDFSKYSINGQGEYSKGKVVQEAISLYVSKHPEMSDQEIVDAWLALRVNVPNFIETQSAFEQRTQASKDTRINEKAKQVQLSNSDILYVSNQFDVERINDFIHKVNAQDWDIRIEKNE